MWMNKGRLDDARASFDDARRRVPAYAPAQGHLAVIEAELGETESALARLYSLAASSDDPEHAAQLARILKDAGCAQARHWSQLAARVMTSWSRLTRRPSRIMQPNSGLLRALIGQGTPAGENEYRDSQDAARVRLTGRAGAAN